MTTMFHTALICAALAASAGTAQAQTAVKMEGRCEKLVIAGLDITQNCKESLTNSVVGNRTSFDFAAWDGQTLSFAGSGAVQEATELTEQLQPINLVTPGQSSKEGIARSPAPAVGACRFSTPAPGKSAITCEATSQGKTYAGTFVTDAKPKEAPAKP
ncbi:MULTISPECIES: hypothetical protein [Methylobacterium]|uniref:Uncharacterized protein n=1 Tax=Methylobacterium thuringiense TaxID=1003091 RepID=A0ABQ4TF09_9HYPH|nr:MULTISPECIES: hypothetical protein [Methylobacterium]TXN22217.1 hypothetical protein FV217_11670 [Methylobacterium sp. WL9]GJE53576.1 hypothetical protein EKPJFOCH_0041 [Methylobacterium thuringiense]